MKTRSSAAFAAQLAQSGTSQAAFARLTGVTPRQVNAWCRGHAAVPRWAALLALVLAERSAETLTIALDEANRRDRGRPPALASDGYGVPSDTQPSRRRDPDAERSSPDSQPHERLTPAGPARTANRDHGPLILPSEQLREMIRLV